MGSAVRKATSVERGRSAIINNRACWHPVFTATSIDARMIEHQADTFREEA
jgi:hypothetical protein